MPGAASGLASGLAYGFALASASGFLAAFGFSFAGSLAFYSGYFADFFLSSVSSAACFSAPADPSSLPSGCSPAASCSFFYSSSAALAFFTSADDPSPLPFSFAGPFLSAASDLSFAFLASFLELFPSNSSFNFSYSYYLYPSSLAHLSLLAATLVTASFSLSNESTMFSS